MLRITFLVLSLLDYSLTAALLAVTGPVGEANPLAAAAYAAAGPLGLLAFKSAAAAVVVAAVTLVGRRRPRAAAALWLFACAVSVWAILVGVHCHAIIREVR